MKKRAAWLAAVMALAASLLLPAAASADAPVSLGPARVGWNGAAAPTGWIPISVDVKNDGGGPFSGLVRFQGTLAGYQRPSGAAATYYDVPVTVPGGTTRTATTYVPESNGLRQPYAFQPLLLDAGGHSVLATGQPATASLATTVGVLSGASSLAAGLQLDVRVRGASIRAVDIPAPSVPHSALQLSGLSALVLTGRFESGALAEAQLTAIRQYVGFGGSLIVTGGSGWRHTLGQLPDAFPLPIRPRSDASVSLAPLGELIGRPLDVTAPAGLGTPVPGARVVLSDAAGQPLLSVLDYGAGSVLEASFDPTDDGVAGTPAATEAWDDLLNYATRAPNVTATVAGGLNLVENPSGGPVKQPVGPTSVVSIVNLLRDTRANALPGVGLLGLLLTIYVVILWPANYLVLRLYRRRELLWISVPLIAALFTGAAYAGGGIVHGPDYYVNEVQLIRAAPDGAVALASWDAVYSPRRGDVAVQLPDGALATIVTGVGDANAGSAGDSVVGGRSPFVQLRDVAPFSPRDLESERVLAGGLALDVKLARKAGRVVGTITNRGRATVDGLRYLGPEGEAPLAGRLVPGATASVDFALGAVGSPEFACLNGGVCGSGSARYCAQGPCSDGGSAGTTSRTVAATEIAALQMLGRGVVAGTTEPLPAPRIAGRQASRDVIAAFAVPAPLSAVDNPGPMMASSHFLAVSSTRGAGMAAQQAVVDFDWPAGFEGSLRLSGRFFGGNMAAQVYDWTARTWRPVDLTSGALVTAGERQGPALRMRFTGQGTLDVSWAAAG